MVSSAKVEGVYEGAVLVEVFALLFECLVFFDPLHDSTAFGAQTVHPSPKEDIILECERIAQHIDRISSIHILLHL